MEKECEFCTKTVYLNQDRYVLIGTYSKKNVIGESYFHWQCFKVHWEKRVRTQAENIVKNMANKILPVAKGIIGGAMKG